MSFEQGGHMNRIVLYGDAETVISGGGMEAGRQGR